MKSQFVPLAAALALSLLSSAFGSDTVRPRAGKVEIFREAALKPGM